MSNDSEDSLEREPSFPADQAGDLVGKGTGGPLSLHLYPDPIVWNETRRLAGDKNIRVEDVATCASQDPVLVMDLLRVANAMYFAGGRSPITSTKTAIVRLGYDVVVETLEKMNDRGPYENEDVRHWFEEHRARCRRAAILARILSEALARTLSDDCQAAGLMLFVGEMLAVAHLQDQYVKLADELSRSAINYRLAQDFKFDTERMGLAYLRRYGIPEALLFAIDREARTRAQERAMMKPLCMAAGEMVEAFDANRWEKIAPGKSLPPKSNIRMLQIPDSQYLKIYERCSEYLFAARLEEEKKKHMAVTATVEQMSGGESQSASAFGDDSLQNEIQEILSWKTKPSVTMNETPAPPAPPPPTRPPPQKVEENQQDDFNLDSARLKGKKKARAKANNAAPEAGADALYGKEMLSSLTGMFNQVKSSEELLTQLMDMLVKDGPFTKTALIVVSGDRKRAKVVAARGPDIGSGQTLILEDPLSPLAQCFSKIQSFGNRENKNSPFGSKSYALAPIDADHDTPVALYADCGNNGSVSFEARRIFRTVVEALNEKLPQIPGGIPVEV